MSLFGLPGDPTDRIYERSQTPSGGFYGAVFSLDRRYRYALYRIWGPSKQGLLVFVMLNPSTAHGRYGQPKCDDATIRSCMRIARALGYAGIVVVNLFALCMTDPLGLKVDPDPIGPLNDQYLRTCAEVGSAVVAAWGSHNKIKELLRPRAEAVLKLLRTGRGAVFAFGHNKDLQPKHPLYLMTSATLTTA